MSARNSFLAVGTGLMLLGPVALPASAQVVYGSRNRPFEGRRYETMRALAHYLDETAQNALQTAVADARRGASERSLLPAFRDFAQRADRFHTEMDNYETNRRDVAPRVSDLIQRARRVNERLPGTYLATSTREDWTNVVDVLDRMKRVMAGQDVEVPMAHGGFEDYDRDYGMFGVRRTGDSGGSAFGWQGNRLADFRSLARDLDESALRSHQIAEQNRANYSARQQEFLSDLRRFAERSHAVRVQADNRDVSRRDIAPIVNQLLQDARATDRSLRDTRVFPQVWDQWTRTIDVLNRMADLARD